MNSLFRFLISYKCKIYVTSLLPRLEIYFTDGGHLLQINRRNMRRDVRNALTFRAVGWVRERPVWYMLTLLTGLYFRCYIKYDPSLSAFPFICFVIPEQQCFFQTNTDSESRLTLSITSYHKTNSSPCCAGGGASLYLNLERFFCL